MYQDKSYFSGLFCGIKSICIGLKTTMREFFTPKITEQYPENRKELKMFDRFRGSLSAWPAAFARCNVPTTASMW